MSYQEYLTIPGYRQKCQKMLQPIIQQIQAYQAEDYQYLGVIGINESPNCSISGQRGVLMEEFFAACQVAAIETPYLEVPTWYSEAEQQDFLEELQRFLAKGGKNE